MHKIDDLSARRRTRNTRVSCKNFILVDKSVEQIASFPFLSVSVDKNNLLGVEWPFSSTSLQL